jgi:hypothetical protein
MSRRLLRAAFLSGPLAVSIPVAVMLYALLVPHFVIYSYMIVFVPVLALVIPAIARMNLAPQSALAAVCITGIPILPGTVGDFLGSWTPFLLLWACWGVLLLAERAGKLTAAQ